MKSTERRWPTLALAVTAIVGACFVSSSCGKASSPSSTSSSTSAKASHAPYLVGAELELTGPLAALSPSFQRGMSAYFEYRNHHGGINGHPVKLSVLDNANSTSNSIAVLNSLVSRHVSAVAGFINSTDSAAIAPVVDRKEGSAVVFAHGISTDQVHDKWFFGTSVDVPDQGASMPALAKYLLHGEPIRAALLFQETTGGIIERKQARSQIQKLGGSVVSDNLVPLSAVDIRTQTSNIASARPNVVIAGTSGSMGPLLQQQLRAQGYDGIIIDHAYAGPPATIASFKDPSFYVVREFALPTDPGAGIATMNKAMKAANVDASSEYFAINGYAQALVISYGLEKCGYPCSPDRLQSILDHGVVPTGGLTFAPYRYTPDNHGGISVLHGYHWSTAKQQLVAVPFAIPYKVAS